MAARRRLRCLVVPPPVRPAAARRLLPSLVLVALVRVVVLLLLVRARRRASVLVLRWLLLLGGGLVAVPRRRLPTLVLHGRPLLARLFAGVRREARCDGRARRPAGWRRQGVRWPAALARKAADEVLSLIICLVGLPIKVARLAAARLLGQPLDELARSVRLLHVCVCAVGHVRAGGRGTAVRVPSRPSARAPAGRVGARAAHLAVGRRAALLPGLRPPRLPLLMAAAAVVVLVEPQVVVRVPRRRLAALVLAAVAALTAAAGRRRPNLGHAARARASTSLSCCAFSEGTRTQQMAP